MARATLKLTGVYEAWAPFVRQGRLQRANGSESLVLVRVLEGAPADEASLAVLREDGRLLARLQHENVLRVEQTSGVGGQLALVHENFDCVGMQHVVAALKARGQVLPSRVAVEVASAVAIALDETWKITDGERRLIHGSPTPGEVLVDTSGRVKLAGIQVLHLGESWPAAAVGYAAPEGPGGWQAATWMVGALLVELLTGEGPQDGATDANRHEAMLRRVVLKLLARPGDTPGDLLVQAVRQALAHDVEARGTPGAFGRMLRDLAVQLPTPGLRAWAPGTIPAVQRRAAPRTGPTRTLAPADQTSLPTPPLAPPLPELPLADSPTMEDPEPTVLGVAGFGRDSSPPVVPVSTGASPWTVPGAAPRPAPSPRASLPPAGETRPVPVPSSPASYQAAGETRPVPAEPSAVAPSPAAPTVAERLGGPAFGLPGPRGSSPGPSVASPRPVPQRLTGGPAMGGAGSASGPALGPTLGSVGNAPGIPAAPLVALPESGDDESEKTVVARALPRDEAPVAPAPDPLVIPLPRSPSVGPAPAAVHTHSAVDEEPPRQSRSMIPMVLGALTVAFVLSTAVVLGVAGWYFSQDDAPATEPVSTLGDVVGEAPVAAPTPGGRAAAPIADAPEPAVEAPPPAAVAPPPAAVAPPPEAPTPEPAKVEPPKPAPEPAKAGPAEVAAAPAKAQPAKAEPAKPAARPTKTEEDPVRIGAKPPSTPPEKAPPPVTPAPSATPAAPAAPEVSGPFKVTFTAADAGMSLEVKCMQGGGTGPSVTIEDAVKGNCRVVGKSDAATVMTLVTVGGPRSYSCFAGGSRSCR